MREEIVGKGDFPEGRTATYAPIRPEENSPDLTANGIVNVHANILSAPNFHEALRSARNHRCFSSPRLTYQ